MFFMFYTAKKQKAKNPTTIIRVIRGKKKNRGKSAASKFVERGTSSLAGNMV